MGISLHSRLTSNSLLTDFGLLAIPLPHPPEYWDYRHAPPCLAQGPPVFVLLFCFLNPEAEGMSVDPSLLVTAVRSLPPAVSPGQACPMVREGGGLHYLFLLRNNTPEALKNNSRGASSTPAHPVYASTLRLLSKPGGAGAPASEHRHLQCWEEAEGQFCWLLSFLLHEQSWHSILTA